VPRVSAVIDRGDLRPMAILLAFGALLRGTLLLASSGILWPDTGIFVLSARSLLTDRPFYHDPYKAPLYSLFLSGFMACGETHATGWAIIVSQQFLGLASTAVFYLVARRVFGRTVALWSSLLFSAHTLQLFYELSVLSEALFVVILAILVHQTVRALGNPTWGTAAWVGLLSGLATLTRPVAQAFVVVLVAWVILANLRGQLRRALAAAAVMLVAYAATVVPWMYVNHRTLGYFGVSLGQGFGLVTRVFMLDQADPVLDTRYPDAKEALEFTRRAKSRNPYVMRRRLRSVHRYPAVELDRRLSGFALETIRAHPWEFAHGSVRNWTRQMLVVREDIHVCREDDGGPYLCSSRMTGRSSKLFANKPTAGRRPLKEAVARWFEHGYTRMNLLVPLAFAGIALSLFSTRVDRGGAALLAATIAYFTSIPALIAFPDERFRLPIDPFLFMFAVFAVAAAVSVGRRAIGRAREGGHRPPAPALEDQARQGGSGPTSL
jgi:hypothetical protein